MEILLRIIFMSILIIIVFLLGYYILIPTWIEIDKNL